MNLQNLGLIFFVVALSAIIFIHEIEQKQEHIEQLKQTNQALQTTRDIENEVNSLSPYQRCLALGGMSNECKVLMRGLDKTSKSP